MDTGRLHLSQLSAYTVHTYTYLPYYNPDLSFDLFESPVDRTLGNLHGRCLWLVCPAGKLEPAFTAFPDTGAPALNRLHVAFRAAVKRS
jgi:hypothetical protein